MTPERVIGRQGELPWRLSADLKRFRRLTMGHPLLMGRRTYESIGRPLPGRTSIVITRQKEYKPTGVVIADSLATAIQIARESETDEAFIIGGSEIYSLGITLVERLYITEVMAEVDGDVTFPEIDWSAWQRQGSEAHPADEQNEFAYRFEVYHRT